MVQMDFFLTQEECELSMIRKNQNELKEALDRVRKGTYAEINALKKVCIELSARQEIIERNICLSK